MGIGFPTFKTGSKLNATEMKPTRQRRRTIVDSRGIWCPPTPLTDLFKAWRKVRLGDVIELRASEPTIVEDVRAWAKKSGNKVVEVIREKDHTRVVVQITKIGKEVAEMSAMKTNMKEPDETKNIPKGKLQLVTMGGFTFGLRTLEPGWRWSDTVKPMVKTESCDVRHIGYVVAGRMGFAMDDGTMLEVGAGDAFDVLPGHDAWTVGSGPVVFVDMISAAEQAKTADDIERRVRELPSGTS
jgi:TusA-related sulfurtransferase